MPATRSAESLRQQEAQRRGYPHLQRSDLLPKAPAVRLVRHPPILSQARALTRGRLTLVGLLRAQARIRPAAVVVLIELRGIAPRRAPLYPTADASLFFLSNFQCCQVQTFNPLDHQIMDISLLFNPMVDIIPLFVFVSSGI